MSQPQPVHERSVVRTAAALVLVQCFSIAWLLNSTGFAVVASCLTLLALLPVPRWQPERAPHRWWYIALAIVLLAKYRANPDDVPQAASVLSSVIAIEVARFLIILQISQLYIRHPPGRFPVWFAGAATISMIFACDARLSIELRPKTVWLAAVFVVLLASFAAATRRPQGVKRFHAMRLGILSLTLLLVCLTGYLSSRALHRYEHSIERWVLDNLGGGPQGGVAPGFSGRGELGEISGWKQHASDHVAIRAMSKREPGYLRGRVFDGYRDNRWFVLEDVTTLTPTSRRNYQPVRPHDRIYVVREAERPSEGSMATIDIWPDENNRSRLFLPVDTLAVAIQSELVTSDAHLVLSRSEIDADPYTLFQTTGTFKEPLADELRVQCLTVPPAIGPEVHEIAEGLFHDTSSTADKIANVKGFFAQHFRYELRAHRSIGVDAITEFLITRRPGHCEYFAASGAMLLRLGGVPARYATGYVCSEFNSSGDYWMARRKDAHAWIEAYDEDQRRWIVVECTPSNGIPGQGENRTESDLLDALLFRARYFATSSAEIGWLGALEWIGSRLLSLPVLVVAFSLGAVWLLRRRRTDANRVESAWQIPERREFVRLLSNVDRLSSRLGLERSTSETLTQFATRLQSIDTPETTELAQWYLRYADLRYALSPNTGRAATDQSELEATAKQLQQKLRHTSPRTLKPQRDKAAT